MKLKRLIMGLWVMSFLFAADYAWSETIRGEIRSINPEQNTLQIQPRGAHYQQGELTLNVSEDTAFGGIESLQELEVGDTIRVEVDDAAFGQREVTRLESQGLETGQGAWSRKLSRGIVNFFTSPIELPRQIDRVDKYEGPAQAWTVGLVQGIGSTLFRAGVGLVEVLTFPFNFPDENKSPIIQPEYAWQNWPTSQLDQPNPKEVT